MKKGTSSSTGRRRAHLALKKKTLNTCPKCKEAVLPHSACSFCGTYKSKQVLKVKSKKK